MAADFFIGESLVGDGNEIAHIDLIIGSKSGPAGAAFTHALSNNKDGFSTLLAVVTPEPALQARHAALQQGDHQGCQAGGADVRPGAGGRRPRGDGFGERGRHLEDAGQRSVRPGGRVHSLAGRGRQEDLPVQLPGGEGVDRAGAAGQADRWTTCSPSTRPRGIRSPAAPKADRTVPPYRVSARGDPTHGPPLDFSRDRSTHRRRRSAMRKLLLQLDSSRLPSVFDQVVAYDAGADAIMSYGGVTEADVRDLIHGCIFTRGRQGSAQHGGLDRRQQHVGGRAAPRHGAGRAVRALLRLDHARLQRVEHHRRRRGGEDRADARGPEREEGRSSSPAPGRWDSARLDCWPGTAPR